MSTDPGWDTVKNILAADSKLKVLFDPDEHVVTEKFGTKLFPETYIIDSKGIIRLRYDGARDWSDPLTLRVIGMFL